MTWHLPVPRSGRSPCWTKRQAQTDDDFGCHRPTLG